jgi:hypothetical protein
MSTLSALVRLKAYRATLSSVSSVGVLKDGQNFEAGDGEVETLSPVSSVGVSRDAQKIGAGRGEEEDYIQNNVVKFFPPLQERNRKSPDFRPSVRIGTAKTAKSSSVQPDFRAPEQKGTAKTDERERGREKRRKELEARFSRYVSGNRSPNAELPREPLGPVEPWDPKTWMRRGKGDEEEPSPPPQALLCVQCGKSCDVANLNDFRLPNGRWTHLECAMRATPIGAALQDHETTDTSAATVSGLAA